MLPQKYPCPRRARAGSKWFVPVGVGDQGLIINHAIITGESGLARTKRHETRLVRRGRTSIPEEADPACTVPLRELPNWVPVIQNKQAQRQAGEWVASGAHNRHNLKVRSASTSRDARTVWSLHCTREAKVSRATAECSPPHQRPVCGTHSQQHTVPGPDENHGTVAGQGGGG